MIVAGSYPRWIVVELQCPRSPHGSLGSSWEIGAAEVSSVTAATHRQERTAAAPCNVVRRRQGRTVEMDEPSGQPRAARSRGGLVSVPQMPIPVAASAFRHLRDKRTPASVLIERGAYLAIAGSEPRVRTGRQSRGATLSRASPISNTVMVKAAPFSQLKPAALRAGGEQPFERCGLATSRAIPARPAARNSRAAPRRP